jgi:hypothetical protein
LQQHLGIHDGVHDDRRAEEAQTSVADDARQIRAGLPAKHAVCRAEVHAATERSPRVAIQLRADFEISYH